MAWYAQLNQGTKDQPNLLYYRGYYRGGFPPGPILVASHLEAFPFGSRQCAENVIAADERLKGARVVEMPDDANVEERRSRALFTAPLGSKGP